MKGILLIIDGVADQPCQLLGQKTPLEYAKTPNLDFIAKRSKLDYCFPVKEGVAPQSHNAILSLLGYDSTSIPRGPLEAQGSGIKLKPGDLALRTNFAAIDSLEEGNILDKRSGRNLTTKEAKTLAKAINSQLILPNNYKFEFRSTIQHRGVLVFRGGFSDNISNADPYYGKGVSITNAKNKIQFSHPLDEEDDSKLSSELLNTFMRKSHEILDKHPINQKRAKKGLYMANFLTCREPGSSIIRLKKLKGNWMSLSIHPLENGIAKAVGMSLYYNKAIIPKLRGIDVYSSLYKSLKHTTIASIKMLKRNYKKYDYFYIHIKEPDIPGHDNLPLEKVKMIELIDSSLIKFLSSFAKNTRLIITADHTTSSRLKSHTSDPVPVLTYPLSSVAKKDTQSKERRFTEEYGKTGKKIQGQKLLESNFF